MTENNEKVLKQQEHLLNSQKLSQKRTKRLLEQELEFENKKLGEITDLDIPDNITELDEEAKNKDFARRNKTIFINDQISQMVFSAPYSLLLIAGRVGKGKSTTTANIIASYIRQNKKVLVIANEEAKIDVFDRVACIIKQVSFYKYVNGLSSQEDLSIVKRARNILASRKFLKVVGLEYKNNPDYVTSVDGVTKLIKSGIENYDVVILDYFQKITKDSKNPSKTINDIQNDLAHNLDNLKNKAKRGPIIVFSQMWGESSDRKDFESQLKGRKTIFDVCTGAYEITANKGDFTTSFICHKNRWDGTYVSYALKQGFHKELTTFISNYQDNKDFLSLREQWISERLSNNFYLPGEEDEDE